MKIKRSIIVEDKILKFIPITIPEMKKVTICRILPNPISKCDPTNDI